MADTLSKKFVQFSIGAVLIATLVVGLATWGEASDAKTPSPATARGAEARMLGFVEEVRAAERMHYLLGESSVATCMRDAGFTYHHPDLGSGTVPPMSVMGDDGETGSDFAAKNHSYVESLSEDDQLRYAQALHGSDSAPEVTIEEPSGATLIVPMGGCLGEARQALLGEKGFRTLQTALFRAESIPMAALDVAAESRAYRDLTADLETCYEQRDVQSKAQPSVSPTGLEGPAVGEAAQCISSTDAQSRLQGVRDVAAAVAMEESSDVISSWEAEGGAIIETLEEELQSR